MVGYYPHWAPGVHHKEGPYLKVQCSAYCLQGDNTWSSAIEHCQNDTKGFESNKCMIMNRVFFYVQAPSWILLPSQCSTDPPPSTDLFPSGWVAGQSPYLRLLTNPAPNFCSRSAVIESQRFSGGLGGLLPAVAVSDFLSDDSTAFIDIPEPDSLYVLTVDLRELSGALNAFKDGIVSV